MTDTINWRSPLLLLAIVVVFHGEARAQPLPLTTDEVLQSSIRHYPLILKSLAARRAALGQQLEAQGAFDLVFDVSGFSRLSGFYDGTALSGKMTQRFSPLGASMYGGYKLSDGTFPVYEDIHFTNTGGTLQLGVLFSLLRNRDIDEERFDLTDAELAIREAEFDLLLTQIGVQQRALAVYWRWVTVGRQLKVYQNLLRIALERQDGLEKQVREGATAQIFLTENLQNITRRQTLVKQAERDLEIAANSLSLFYRDSLGRPQAPTPDRLPPSAALNETAQLAPVGVTALPETLQRRPELALLRTAILREQNRAALIENDLQPQLDMSLEVQTGLGSVAEGGESRDSTDTIVGLRFSVPLQRREEQGRLDQTRAEIDAKRAEEQLRMEQIEVEVRNLLAELRVSRELMLLAAQQVAQSEILRVSELRRFQSGASDFFLVNVREETAADSRIRLLQAELAIHLARAKYDAATVNVERLGISTGSTPEELNP